jgi:hypothetical protein
MKRSIALSAAPLLWIVSTYLPISAHADDAEDIKKVVESIKKEGAISNSPTPSAEDSELMPSFDPFAKKVLSHIRGKEGVPFPGGDEMVWDPAIDALYSATPAPDAPTPKPYERPRRCEKNETTRTIDYPSETEEPKALYDIIYLSEELVPLDPGEAFGEKARLYTYGPQSDESVYTRMEIHDVPCVPYRQRITNKATYRDYGNNALRNYDKDPAGKGTFDPRIQAKLFGGPPPRRPQAR